MNIKVTFVSNFINHHQIPFCDEMYKRLKDNFAFIQVQPMDENRINMGWDADTDSLPYLHKEYEEEDRSRELIADCDLLLLGWTGLKKGEGPERVIADRMSLAKPVIRISERIYREGRYKAISPRGLMAKYDEHIRFRKSPVYLLCAGAYVSGDFDLIGAYPGKMFKWGYFPPLKRYDDKTLESMLFHEGEKLRICLAGRMIKLKHQEFAIYAAEYLKDAGADFIIEMAGDGPQREELEKIAAERKVSENIVFHGSASPQKVREIMERSHIFIFGSNYLEGWGAVVNEAMNSCCAVIASEEAGAVPFLIENGENGLTYEGCDRQKFIKCLERLLKNHEEIRDFQRKAYETIIGEWNAENACDQLLKFGSDILSSSSGNFRLPQSGPMSAAKVLKAPGFFRTLKEDNHLE